MEVKKNGMAKVRVIDVTPEIAKEILSRNYKKNRKVRKAYVEQLAHVMKDGRFLSENGQTIVIGEEDNVLYDGQHRLSAIVMSGTTQRLLVVYVKNGKEAYKTIDNNTKRLASDFLDVPNKTACAAVAKFMACVEWGDSPLLSCLQGKWDKKTTVDRGTIVNYVELNSTPIVESVREGTNMRNMTPVSAPTTFSKFIMLVRYCGMDDCLNEFIEEFRKIASDNMTVNALKMGLMRQAANKGKRLEDKYVIGTLLDGYTHFCDVDDSTMLNKQNLRLKQYQKYMDSARARKKNVKEKKIA